MKLPRNALSLITILLTVFYWSCKEDNSNLTEPENNSGISYGQEAFGTDLVTSQNSITNGNMENQTVGYWKGGTTFNGYSFVYSDKESVSPTHSLSIESKDAKSGNFVYWAQTFKAAQFVGKKVTISVSTKYSGVDGDGVMLVFRGDDTDVPNGSAEAFATTQGKIELKGSTNWRTLEVKLDPVPENIKSLTVYMLIASKNGTVFFDDLSLASSTASPPLTNVYNGNFETGAYSPDAWWTGSSGSGFNFNWETSEYLSPSHSVSITTAESNTYFAFWAQTIMATDLIGKKLTLDVNIKAKQLSGGGIYIAIRCDDTFPPSGVAAAFSTTQNNILINGTFDWKKHSVTLDKVPVNTKAVTFYLIYGTKTSGTAFFDDVSLTKQ